MSAEQRRSFQAWYVLTLFLILLAVFAAIWYLWNLILGLSYLMGAATVLLYVMKAPTPPDRPDPEPTDRQPDRGIR